MVAGCEYGGRYTGDFVDDKFEGLGICEFVQGSVYHGEYVSGQTPIE